jgi:hypothetical protein
MHQAFWLFCWEKKVFHSMPAGGNIGKFMLGKGKKTQ